LEETDGGDALSGPICTLHLPQQTEWGAGATERARDAIAGLGAAHAFVVADPAVAAAGHLERLIAALRPATRLTVFGDVEPEPTVAAIDDAAGALRSTGDVDVVVTVGGGSAIDTAKCAIVLALNGGALSQYADGVEQPRDITRVLPHVALPTTAGTGSEATAWAVFVDPGRHSKDAVFDRRLVPAVAILDPELTSTVPPAVTAGTGMDALTHAIESYVSRLATPVTEALALEAVALVRRHLRRAVADGTDMEARTGMLLASFMAGVAFSNSSCGLVHTLSEALGGLYRVPHGTTNGVLLAPVMALNAPACEERFARLASALTAEAAASGSHDGAAAVAAVRDLAADIGLPASLSDLGVPRVDLPAVSAAAFEWANDSGNPRDVTIEQIRELLDEAYGPGTETA
jgi:alcohol dehydrogenase class IV